MIGSIELTAEETQMISAVRNEQRGDLDHNPERHKAAGQTAYALLQSLRARKVIPEERQKYFFDPEYNNGNSKASHYDIFLRNAGSQEKVFTHAHFFKHLLYFVDGPNLPDAVKMPFATLASEYFREDLALAKLSRQLARNLPGSNRERAELFFQLALDCGCGLIEAQSVRQSVMHVQ